VRRVSAQSFPQPFQKVSEDSQVVHEIIPDVEEIGSDQHGERHVEFEPEATSDGKEGHSNDSFPQDLLAEPAPIIYQTRRQR